MIFPETKFKQKIKDFSLWDSKKKELTVPPNHESMQSFALEAYLEQYRAILSECKILNIEATTAKIMHIFETLNIHPVSNDKGIPSQWKCEELFKVRDSKKHQHAIMPTSGVEKSLYQHTCYIVCRGLG